jgi:hypothetical protein
MLLSFGWFWPGEDNSLHLSKNRSQLIFHGFQSAEFLPADDGILFENGFEDPGFCFGQETRPILEPG